MRSFQLASFLLLAGTVTMACSSTEDPGGDGDGDSGVGAAPATGGSASTGGGTPGTGSMTGDGDGDGTGGTASNSACTNTVVATGMPTMIDDFESEGFPNFPDDADGRVGTWEHEYWNPEGGDRLFQDPVLVEGAMNFKCEGGVDEAWCETAWSADNAWGQWADTGTRFTTYSATDVNCYDASVFTGIKFKAQSPLGDKIQLKLNTPETSTQMASDQGWAFKGPVITLTADPTEYTVPFSDVKVPDWVAGEGGPSGAVTANSLISMAFVIRSVTDETEGEVMGESLNKYNVTIDDVEFY